MAEQRILIAGRPRTGKTTLADKLGAGLRIPVRHADDLNKTHDWSAQSLEVATWLDGRGPWIIEGTTVVRAIRKWMDRMPPDSKPADVVYWGEVPYVPLDPNQTKFGNGIATIWKQIHDQLVARGVEIRQVR